MAPKFGFKNNQTDSILPFRLLNFGTYNLSLELNLPEYHPELKREGEKLLIKCAIRKKWLVLTPEEWVRQHFMNYMFTERGYSRNLTSVEHNLEYNGLKKRIDILTFDQEGKPKLMVECKAPHIPLDEKVIFQLSTYNSKFKLQELCITNGMVHHWFRWENGKYESF